MIAAASPEVDVEQLMSRIREEVARRKRQLGHPTDNALLSSDEPPAKSPPELGELLRHEGEAFVAHAYRTLLGREPDAGGLQDCLARLSTGMSTRTDLLRGICRSEEGRNIGAEVKGLTLPYALGELLGGDDAGFVASAYRALLGREPDEDGARTYRERLADSSLSRVDVLRILRFSNEGRQLEINVAGLLPPVADAPPAPAAAPPAVEYSLDELLGGDDAEFVANAYRTLLGREPDAEGWHTYQEALSAGTLTRTAMLQALRDSAEGQQAAVEIKGLTVPYALGELLGEEDPGFVANAYRALLGREPDAEGAWTYQERLADGSLSRVDVLRILRFSDEGRRLRIKVAGLLPPVADVSSALVCARFDTALDLDSLLCHREVELATGSLIESRNPEINVIELMARIREEAARLPPVRTLGELLVGDNVEFVANAYRTLLGREPDTGGWHAYQEALSAGALTRIEILQGLRDSDEGRRLGIDVAGLLPSITSPAVVLNAWPMESLSALEADPGEAQIAIKPDYDLGELLGYQDEELVRNAYRAILRREPDPEGLRTYLGRLRQGSLSKLDILGGLRFSSEGRTMGIAVHGLLLPFLLHVAYRVPVLGFLMALVSILLRPGKIIGRLRGLEANRDYEARQRRILAGRLDRGFREYSTQTANRFGQFALELNQLKLLADAKASELERSLSDFAKHLSDGFQEYSTQTANRFGQFALELNQLKLLADAKVNRLEQSDATHRLSRQLDHQLARSADHLAQLEVELRQLKLLADAKANEIELTRLQREVGELKQGKADRSGLETLRVSLRNVLEGKADASEISVLQLHLKQVIETKAEREALADIHEQLADTQTALAGKAEQQAVADLQGQLQVLDESKSDKSELTRLTNHLVDLVQTKAQADDIIAIREQIQRLASVDSLVEVRQHLQEGLSTKADQTILITLQQSIETRASVEVMDTTIHRLASLEQAKAASDHLSQELVDIRRQILDHKRNIVDQQRRLALLLEEARKRLPEPLNQAQLVVMGNESDHLLDTMYVAFEDCFRGTREDIKQRLSAYLPSLPQGVGSGFAPAVDLGCGRGEWLELLKERGLAATGVDLNRVMAEFCRERELEVVEADALAYLCDQPDSSLGLITGFHIIEHVPLRTLIALLDESLRVLQPGGMVIFETPNPENLVVGACNFYMDPTHRNPLPPTMTQFLVEARGFVRCEIRRMNQQVLNDPLRLLEPGTPGVVELNPLIQMAKDHYFAAPDYAVIGYKA